MKIIIINGPNLNLLGKREPHIYGSISFESYFEEMRLKYADISLDQYQSNIEGEIIDKIHAAPLKYDGIILNPGAYAHTSVAIRDAVEAVAIPVVEVHISNIFDREDFRKQLIIAPKSDGIITGFGMFSYDLGISALRNKKPN